MAQQVRKQRSFNAFLSSAPLLPELLEHVDVGTKWYFLGTLLHVDDKRLDGIEQLQGHDDTSKTLKMFQHWLTTTPTASRRQVLEALRKRAVNEHTVADKYEKCLMELHNTTKAVSILEKNIESLNEVLVSPVQVSQLLYCKGCISEATLDEMERIDQSRSLNDKKTTLLTAIQETVSSDFRKLKDIATVLSDVEGTKHIGKEIMTKYKEKISQDDDSALVQPKEVVGSNEDCANDILRNNYGSLSQSITEPVCMARLLHEEVISDEALSCVIPTGVSVSDSRAVLLKAVRDAVHSNYKHLELFVTVLRKFSETAHIGDAIFKKYKQCFPDGNSSIEEIECLLGTQAIAQGQVGHRILIPRNMSPEFTSIRTEFGLMFYKIRKIITSQKIDSNELKKLIADCFPDLKPLLENIENMDDILDVVKGKCNLIDVHCLQVIVQAFNITEGQEHLDSYKEKVNKFCKSMSSRLCVDQVLQIIRTPTRLASETVVLILDWNPDDSTIEDIKNLLSVLLNANFQIETIGTGQSIVVTCYCPAEYTGSLIMAVLDKIKTLQKRGLKKFTIGSCTVWDATQLVNENTEGADLLAQINDLKADLKDREDRIMELASFRELSEKKLKELKEDLEKIQCINDQKEEVMKERISVLRKEFVQKEVALNHSLEDTEKELAYWKKLSENRLQEVKQLNLKLKLGDNNTQKDGRVIWIKDGVLLVKPSVDQCMEVISGLEDEHEIVTLIDSSSDSIQYLIPAVLETSSIYQLVMYSLVSRDDILSFSSKLSTNKSLTALAIYNDSIRDDGVIALAQSLQCNETLQYLFLCHNPGITAASTESLAELLLTNKALKYLNLHRTNIDTNGVVVLMESLKTNNTMKKLWLDEQHKETCSTYFEHIKERLAFL